VTSNMEWVVTVGLVAILCAIVFGSMIIVWAIRQITHRLIELNITLKAGVITEVVLGGPSSARER
jgi:hypothetical protein